MTDHDGADNNRSTDVTDERRQSPRIRIALDAQYKRLGRAADPASTTTVDVSHGGARITAPTQLAVGDVLELTVSLPPGIELTLQGLVVQLSDDNDHRQHAHVAFDSLSTVAADLLTELIDSSGATSPPESAGQ